MKTNKTIVILGSTGSVGTQTVDAAINQGATVAALAAFSDVKTMEAQARQLHPRICVLQDETAANDLRVKLADTNVEVRCGREALLEIAALPEADIIFNSVSGSCGLEPTLAAIDAKKTLALANKESIVMAGEIVMPRAKANSVQIIPVDSEHSAIFQCLQPNCEIERILLTASGGPFFGKKRADLKNITPSQALAHPTWKMGGKLTIDSATLMNKGFEVIEAVHLFDVKPEHVEVLVHRESIVHSMVEYRDHAIIAQLSLPDMRLCAQYALTYPTREAGLLGRLDLTKLGQLTFFKPDMENFPLLKLAFDCIKVGGVLPAALVVADEVAVSHFVDGLIGFDDIPDVVAESVSRIKNVQNPTLEDIKAAADAAFYEATAICKVLHKSHI